MSSKYLTQAEMWQAVAENDAGYDGAFVYAVCTTRVYCRPSCRSRRPNRENVVFFHTAGEAEQASYRACKRCQPDKLRDSSTQLVEAISRYIESHIEEGPVALKQLAQVFHLSPSHLQRLFKREMGVSPREYADTVRLGVFKQRIRTGDTVTNAIFAAGYGSNSRLYARVDEQLGMKPSEYQNGGPADIWYAAAVSPLGVVLVAATVRGICAVRIGDTVEELVHELRAEFPAAHVTGQPDALGAALDVVLKQIAGEVPRVDLPLDIQATAFQRRVWQALQDIPYGETRTYADVARAVDRPAAARAVGNACGSNPLAILIPCHRVVKSDGSAGNYRWGAERKARLLAIERQK